MTHDEAMDGLGREITFSEAIAELKRHGVRFGPAPHDGPNPSSGVAGNRITFYDLNNGNEYVDLPLNSKAILEWLGY